MERRTLIAVFLSFIVLYAYQAYFVPATPPRQAASPSNAAPQAPGASTSSPSSTAPTAAPPVAEREQAPSPQAVTTEATDREITVDTGRVEAVFSNRGAKLIHWRLKDYADNEGRPVDLVPTELPANEPQPFMLRASDAALTARLNEARYKVSGDLNGRLDARSAGGTLTFEFQDVAGLSVRKERPISPWRSAIQYSVYRFSAPCH